MLGQLSRHLCRQRFHRRRAAPVPVIEHVAPAPVVTNETAPVIEDIAPALVVSNETAPVVMNMTTMQRSREERDATGQAVASQLGLTWPPEWRIRRRGRPTADTLWCDALQNLAREVAFGHHDDDEGFSANVLIDGGLVMPWCQRRAIRSHRACRF